MSRNVPEKMGVVCSNNRGWQFNSKKKNTDPAKNKKRFIPSWEAG
jgi:hypothetical protein